MLQPKVITNIFDEKHCHFFKLILSEVRKNNYLSYVQKEMKIFIFSETI